MATKKVDVIGGAKNFWLYSEADGYDLTHPPTPDSSPIQPRLSLKTTTSRVTVDPAKTALVVVDLQNYFLSPLLGRPADSAGLKVVDKLVEHVIPACRKAGILVVWMGWGLTEQDLEELPPAIIKGFAADTNFENGKKPGPLGSEIGMLPVENGKPIRGGRVMMKEEWNTDFDARLEETDRAHDVWVYKSRLSGFWGRTGVEKALADRGIRTLLFSGGNTDQCVAGSLQDAFTKGFDCLMLSDGCSTTSPEFCKRWIEYNCAGGWGFLLSCKDLEDGVNNMLGSGKD